jgi:prephenate dehydrogenase
VSNQRRARRRRIVRREVKEAENKKKEKEKDNQTPRDDTSTRPDQVFASTPGSSIVRLLKSYVTTDELLGPMDLGLSSKRREKKEPLKL